MATPHILRALGADIQTWHLNEGHAALLLLKLLSMGASRDQVRRRSVFTTHTPVAAGRDSFTLELAQEVLGADFCGLLHPCEDQPHWRWMMREAITTLAPRFSSIRAMQDYAEFAYGLTGAAATRQDLAARNQG